MERELRACIHSTKVTERTTAYWVQVKVKARRALLGFFFSGHSLGDGLSMPKYPARWMQRADPVGSIGAVLRNVQPSDQPSRALCMHVSEPLATSHRQA